MGRTFYQFLDSNIIDISDGNTGKIFGCFYCKTHLATTKSIISKAFHGQHGKAYLFDKVINIIEGEAEDRKMTTGIHTVCDIYCIHCNRVLGWRYLFAFENSQKYKENKYILERNDIISI